MAKYKHNKLDNKKIKGAITVAAKQDDIDRNQFHHLFVVESDEQVTESFWYTLWYLFPETRAYDRVTYCQTCKMFYFDDVMHADSQGNDVELALHH